MKKEHVCSKCQSETMTKRTKINLTIDEKTNDFMPVSSRIQVCKSCGHKEYSEKEKARLRELANFYKKESELKEEVEESEEDQASVSA